MRGGSVSQVPTRTRCVSAAFSLPSFRFSPSLSPPQTVLVIGNSASGYDITRELASQLWDRRQAGETNLPKLYQSARSPPELGIPFDAPDAPDYGKEVTLFPPIQKVEGKRIDFEDGRGLEDVDVMFVLPFSPLPPSR